VVLPICTTQHQSRSRRRGEWRACRRILRMFRSPRRNVPPRRRNRFVRCTHTRPALARTHEIAQRSSVRHTTWCGPHPYTIGCADSTFCVCNRLFLVIDAHPGLTVCTLFDEKGFGGVFFHAAVAFPQADGFVRVVHRWTVVGGALFAEDFAEDD